MFIVRCHCIIVLPRYLLPAHYTPLVYIYTAECGPIRAGCGAIPDGGGAVRGRGGCELDPSLKAPPVSKFDCETGHNKSAFNLNPLALLFF